MPLHPGVRVIPKEAGGTVLFERACTAPGAAVRCATLERQLELLPLAPGEAPGDGGRDQSETRITCAIARSAVCVSVSSARLAPSRAR